VGLLGRAVAVAGSALVPLEGDALVVHQGVAFTVGREAVVVVLADHGVAHVEDDEAALGVEGDLDLVVAGLLLADGRVEVDDPHLAGLLLDLGLVADVLVAAALGLPGVDVVGRAGLDLAEDGGVAGLRAAGSGAEGERTDETEDRETGTNVSAHEMRLPKLGVCYRTVTSLLYTIFLYKSK